MRLSERMGRLLVALLVGGLSLMPAGTALAHCDSVSGPVVIAASQALAQNDVKLVLPYVKAEAEAELTAAFHEAKAVSAAGGRAAELAERWFWETAVRLHRQGEGAPYTGLKYETDFGPALHAAEEAIATGDLTEVLAVLDHAIAEQLEMKYHAVVEARERAEKVGTVAANREAVEAVLIFETYVHGLAEAIAGDSHHEAPAGHDREADGHGQRPHQVSAQ